MSNLINGSKNILSILWQDFINLIHIADSAPKDDEQKKLVKELQKEGILFFDNFLDPKECDRLADKILKLTDGKKNSVTLENGTYINFRNEHDSEGSDHGMVDIFYVNKAIPEIDAIDVKFLEKLLWDTHKQKVIKLKTHAYVNRGIQQTRVFHIDNTQPVIYKAFIYLTDVKDESYGPYSFIRRSHRFALNVYRNLIINTFSSKHHHTDMRKVNTEKQVNCVAPKGTLIISNQNGIHRGLPQKPDKTRIALVINYTILSKLSYLHKTARQKLERARTSEA